MAGDMEQGWPKTSKPVELARSRARASVLARYRSDDDPELIGARQKYREENLLDTIKRALAKALPLSDEVRSRIIFLLDGATGDRAVKAETATNSDHTDHNRAYGDGYRAGIRDAQIELIKALEDLSGARRVTIHGYDDKED